MKFLLIFSIAVITATAQLKEPLPSAVVEAWRKVLNQHGEECSAESGVKSELLERLLQYREYPDDRPLKCFMKCQAIKLNFMNEKGEVTLETVIKKLGVADNEAIKKCTAIGQDLCDRGFTLATCVYTSVTDPALTKS